ncbi:MAG TPA: EsaB/YukD family protein [Planctomycetaceae bacterium]|nr:EsaB/YukD family protein [Planctomycetaceae bacterium]
MSDISIEVWDATGNKKQLVEVPHDAEVSRVIAVLVDKMNLPRHSPDGQLMSYKFHHRSSGRQLLDEETLTEAGVKTGDVLRLQPEITAGSPVCALCFGLWFPVFEDPERQRQSTKHQAQSTNPCSKSTPPPPKAASPASS